jgi:hypothetical protein
LFLLVRIGQDLPEGRFAANRRSLTSFGMTIHK